MIREREHAKNYVAWDEANCVDSDPYGHAQITNFLEPISTYMYFTLFYTPHFLSLFILVTLDFIHTFPRNYCTVIPLHGMFSQHYSPRYPLSHPLKFSLSHFLIYFFLIFLNHIVHCAPCTSLKLLSQLQFYMYLFYQCLFSTLYSQLLWESRCFGYYRLPQWLE